MTRQEVNVQLDSSLETRPVAFLVQLASQFDSDIYLEVENRRVNAKSIMGMMTLGLISGMDVTVTANGSDEQEATEKICKYLTKAK